MKARHALAALCFLAATSSRAQWNEEGKPVQDTAWRKTVGQFGAMLLITDDPDAFMKQWENPDPAFRPTMSGAKSVKRGDKVAGLVVFSGCKADDKGLCDAEVSFLLLRPDGTKYGEQKGGELWKGKPTPPDHNLQLSVANLMFRVEPSDPLGRYELHAAVHDKVAGSSFELVQPIEVHAKD